MEEDLKRFTGGQHNRAKGNTAEDWAVRWLERQGFTVLERNVRTEVGEIDVVARDGDTLCFIEVKARAGGTYGPAVAAVTAAKQRRLARAAGLYLALRNVRDTPCRFDVVGLDPSPDGWECTLLRNAFELA